MLLRSALLAVMATFPLGCIHTQLQRDTVQLAGTTAYLQYQQILDNVALFREHPYALPSLAHLGAGSAQLSDTFSPAGSLDDPPGASLTRAYSLGLERQWTQKWEIAPVTNVDDLLCLRELFRAVAGHQKSIACFDDLETVIKATADGSTEQESTDKQLPLRLTNWWTEKKSEASEPFLVGVHGDTKIWVKDEKGFFDFVLVVRKATPQTDAARMGVLFRPKGSLLNP